MNILTHKSPALPALLGLALCLAACDDGPIHEAEHVAEGGKVVKVEGTLTGLDSWPDDYDVSLAGFTDNSADEWSPYATISKVITADANGHVSMSLSGIGGSIETVQVCVLNRLRQRIMTFTSRNIANEKGTDTIRIDLGTVNTSMLNAVQQSVFNASCTACHGGNGRSAAGLDLTEGHSYAALVGQQSVKVKDHKRVQPGDVGGSVLHQVLNTNVSAEWHQNHADMLNKERAAHLLTLIDNWISSGAPE